MSGLGHGARLGLFPDVDRFPRAGVRRVAPGSSHDRLPGRHRVSCQVGRLSPGGKVRCGGNGGEEEHAGQWHRGWQACQWSGFGDGLAELGYGMGFSACACSPEAPCPIDCGR